MKKIKNRNQIQMLRFFPFKSKQFTALLVSTKYKRYISLLQTVQKDNCYKIHHKIHREEKELNRILPAIIFCYGKYWYKNGKIHRDEKDETVEFYQPLYIIMELSHGTRMVNYNNKNEIKKVV